MSDGDILTPFIENYRDVFITYILPRINEPAQACACGVPNAIPHFMANLVLPQVSRTFRRLIPGYKETYEAHAVCKHNGKSATIAGQHGAIISGMLQKPL